MALTGLERGTNKVNIMIPWQEMKPSMMNEIIWRSVRWVKIKWPIHDMPVTIISDMVTFNQRLHENTTYHTAMQLIKQQRYFVVFLFSCFFRWRHMIARAITRNPKLTYILCNTNTTDVEYTHKNDNKSRSDECPNIVSIISQPTPMIHCILHFQAFWISYSYNWPVIASRRP